MKRQIAWLELEQIRRYFTLKYELRRKLLKTAIKSNHTDSLLRLHAKYHFIRIPRLARCTQSHFRCLTTGRARGVNTRYGLSRFTFRNAANKGFLTGIRRGSW